MSMPQLRKCFQFEIQLSLEMEIGRPKERSRPNSRCIGNCVFGTCLSSRCDGADAIVPADAVLRHESRENLAR